MKEIPGLLFKENGALFQTQNRQVVDNLDSLPKPVIDELPFYNSKMVGCIVSARGCPYKCSFCASEKFAHHYRTLSTDLIVDEVEYMIKEKSIRHIVFYDDLLIANKKKVIELISILDKKELLGKCSFSCQVRANLITDEICLLLKKLNVVDVGIGIESFSDKILDYYNKKGVTSEINQRAIDLLNKHGIKVNPSIILGAPIETKEDLLITLRAVYNNIKDSKITSPAWGTLRPYPGTKIWDYAESVGIVSANMDWERFSDWSNFETYLCKQIPKSEFYEIIDEWITKISILAIDRPRVEGNFVIKNPEALSEKIKYFQQKLKKRTVYDLGDELIMEYKD
ncbi:MAG: B12-binding domain-containing radical SAM protein [Bacteroidetes bacterium]|nr:B12-binding domain-containing radical SAM protein [Bacteroidota bacterium]